MSATLGSLFEVPYDPAPCLHRGGGLRLGLPVVFARSTRLDRLRPIRTMRGAALKVLNLYRYGCEVAGADLKIIFSRKGFDSGAGGCPSPIIEGRQVSMPIPTRMPTSTRYGDLNGGIYGNVVRDLTRGRFGVNDWCHLDPDINEDSLPRKVGWRGALGQVSSAQGHLANQSVGAGDLFIFWGLFQTVKHDGGWQFTGRPEHRVWGWLQVSEVLKLGPDGSYALRERPWLSDHPHARPGWGSQNTLYIASDALVLDGRAVSLAGAGCLRTGYRLSHESNRPSIWRVPNWLNPKRGGSGMTYHSIDRWNDDGTLQSAARGQEFVAVPSQQKGVSEWLKALLHETLA